VQINELRDKYELLDIFYNLVTIPSPSLKEDNLISWIKGFCEKEGINFRQDEYGNVYLRVDATDSTKQPYLFSAHMDVVGDSSPVNVKMEEDYWSAEGRTLGADDKAGVACSLYLAKMVSKSNELHGGLEVVLTRDEESGMSGIEHVEFETIKSKYVFVLDADKLGQLLVSGASYTNAYITVEAMLGGHSGIDIADKNRLNAVKLMVELVDMFPQGVFFADETGVITSCNAGACVVGGVKPIENSKSNTSKKFIDELVRDSATNVINTYGKCSYSIRSASVEKENELKNLFLEKVDLFNKKYADLAKATIEFEEHLPAFEKIDDDLISNCHTDVSRELGIKNEVASFHAGAETHIYCQKKNFNNEKLMPFLVGTADVYNMHSEKEKVNYKSFLKGYDLIKGLFYKLNE